MANERDLTWKKWSIIKEQLVSLSALNKSAKNDENFNSVLSEHDTDHYSHRHTDIHVKKPFVSTEDANSWKSWRNVWNIKDFSLKDLNSPTLTALCYFLLGIINAEERNKLISWPLTNIQSQTKFRKGLSTMVGNFQEQYPWAHIKKLPESYFIDPRGCKKKLVDFILRLTNLAIHLVLSDPELLLMHSGNGLNGNDIEIMNEIVVNAMLKEEKLIEENIFSVEDFEAVKNDVTDKCIRWSQENAALELQINNLMKCATSENFIPSEKNGIEGLKAVKDEKLLELGKINDKFLKYHKVSKELLTKLKALKNPVTLNARDFDCEKSPVNIAESTMRVCENLHQLHENLVSLSNTKEEEDSFHQKVILAKTALEKENEALRLFLSKMSLINDSTLDCK